MEVVWHAGRHAHLASVNRATGRLRVRSSAPLKDAIGPNPQLRKWSRRHEPGKERYMYELSATSKC